MASQGAPGGSSSDIELTRHWHHFAYAKVLQKHLSPLEILSISPSQPASLYQRSFAGGGKNTALEICKVFPEVTYAFEELLRMPNDVSEESMSLLLC